MRLSDMPLAESLQGTDILAGVQTDKGGRKFTLSSLAAFFGVGGGGLSDGNYGDIIVSESGANLAIAPNAVLLSKLATQANGTILGNNSGSTAVPSALTASQVKGLLAIAAGDVSGLAATATSTNAANLSGTLDPARLSANQKTRSIAFIIDGGGSVITTGQKGHIEIPFDCTINGWTILANQSGSIVVDVWKNTYANFPPTVANTIAGTEKPTLSSAQKNQDLSLTSWTTNIAAGDILAFNVDSAATVSRVIVQLRVTVT